MHSYIVTSVVGSPTPDSYSPDIYYMNSSGEFVLNDAEKSVLNTTHPIQQIAVFGGRGPGPIVGGLKVTYNVKGGNTTVMNHGNTTNPPYGVVSFGENEVLSSVYGYAGFYPWYRGIMVGSIAFVILDTKTGKSRTAGPFGDTGREQSFSVSDVLAFGSFGTSTSDLTGLVFFKLNPPNSVDTALIPESNPKK